MNVDFLSARGREGGSLSGHRTSDRSTAPQELREAGQAFGLNVGPAQRTMRESEIQGGLDLSRVVIGVEFSSFPAGEIRLAQSEFFNQSVGLWLGR
jgi:hypothetical protein